MPLSSATSGRQEQDGSKDNEASQKSDEGVEQAVGLKWWEVFGIVALFLVIRAAHAEKEMARGRR